MIEKRQAPDWDRANHPMATEIEPAPTRLGSAGDPGDPYPCRGGQDGGEMAAASQTIHCTPAGHHQRHPAGHPGGVLLFSRRLTRDIASLVKRAGLVADGRLPSPPARASSG